MKTAEERIKELGGFTEVAFQDKYKDCKCISVTEAVKLINEAVRDCIDECAKNVELKINDGLPPRVDKQSIIKLKEQVA